MAAGGGAAGGAAAGREAAGGRALSPVAVEAELQGREWQGADRCRAATLKRGGGAAAALLPAWALTGQRVLHSLNTALNPFFIAPCAAQDATATLLGIAGCVVAGCGWAGRGRKS